MGAISMERTSRTVIDATTSSRLSFSLTLLCRMSRIATAALPLALALAIGRRYAARRPVHPRSEQARTIHELHDRLQVDPRRGLGPGMASARRSRRLLPPDRQIRDDRPHLQPHHRAHPRQQGPPADQPLRHALQGDHGVEPGEDRPRGRDHLTDYGINKSGYVIHGAIHRARPDVACVLHTHTRAGIAVSAMKCGLLPLSQTMRNHGLLTCGATIQQAFNTMYQLELSCRSQVDAMAARTELVMPGENVLAHSGGP